MAYKSRLPLKIAPKNIVRIICNDSTADMDGHEALRYKSFLASVVTGPAKILTTTELFTKPADFFLLSEEYNLSKLSEVTSINVIPDPSSMTVTIYYPFRLTQHLVLQVDVMSLVPQELRKNPKLLMTWYLYIITCLTYYNQERTFFIQIDDDTKLLKAIDNVNAGDPELPCLEFAYLTLLTDLPISVPIDNSNIREEIKPYRYTHNILGCREYENFFAKPVGSNPGLPDTEMPELNLDGLEERLYNLFVYLMKTQKYVGADTETTGLDIFFAKLVSIGFSFDTHLGFYVSVEHKKAPKSTIALTPSGFIASLVSKRSTFGLSGGLNYIGRKSNGEQNISNGMLMRLITHLKSLRSIWHNAQFDYNILLSNTGISVPPWLDTMIAHYITRPGNGVKGEMRRSLKIIACKELHIPSWKIDVVKFQYEDKDIAATYNARDTCYMLGMAFLMGPDMLNKMELIFDIEMPYLVILARANRHGIRLDSKRLHEIGDGLKARVEKIKESFMVAVPEGEKFNINSVPMLKNLFYNNMHIIPPRKCRKCGLRHFQEVDYCVNPDCSEYKNPESAPLEFITPAGEPSLDKHALSALVQGGVTQAKDLIEYRLASKMLSSYCTLDRFISPYDGLIHPIYKQAQTETGRLSAEKPNFQQLPKKVFKYMRTCFTAKPGYCLISADYAGQEIRILAAHTRDEHLIRAYNPCYHCEHNQEGKGEYPVKGCEFENHELGSQCNTVDIHSFITKQVYPDIINVPIEEIKNVPEFNRLRSICKSVTFGLAYGSTAVGLANSTGIPLKEAEEVMDKYFKTFPTIKEFIHLCQETVDRDGELMDMVGRCRAFKFAGWSDPVKLATYYTGQLDNNGMCWPKKLFSKEVNGNRREATNFPIQGLAASMTKIASINIDRMFKEAGMDALLVEFVHDEVIVHCPRTPEDIRKAVDIITEGMEKSINMPAHCVKNHPLGWSWPPYLPMKVEVEVGDNYGEIMEPEDFIAKIKAEEEGFASIAESEASMNVNESLIGDEDDIGSLTEA